MDSVSSLCLVATKCSKIMTCDPKTLVQNENAFIMLESATLRGAGAAFMMFTKKPIVTNKTWKDLNLVEP